MGKHSTLCEDKEGKGSVMISLHLVLAGRKMTAQIGQVGPMGMGGRNGKRGGNVECIHLVNNTHGPGY